MRTWLFYEGRVLKAAHLNPKNERLLREAAKTWTRGTGRRVEVCSGRDVEVIRDGK